MTSLFRPIGFNILFKILNAGLTLLGSVLVARYLGPSNFGEYVSIITLIQIISIPVQAGVSTFVLREVTYGLNSGAISKIKGLKYTLTLFFLVYSLLFAIILSVDRFNQIFLENYTPIVALGALVLPFFGLALVRTATIRACGQAVYASIPEMIINPLVTCCGVLFFILSYGSIDVISAFIIFLAAQSVTFISGQIIMSKVAQIPNYKSTRPVFLLRKWLPEWWRLFQLSALNMIKGKLPIFLIITFCASTEIGYFTVASKIALLFVFVTDGINLVIGPTIIKYYDKNKFEELLLLLAKLTRVAISVSILQVFLILTVGDELISATFGSEFMEAKNILLILAIGHVVQSATGSSTLILNMTKNDKRAGRVYLISVVLLAVSMTVALYFGGPIEATLALVIAEITRNLLLNREVTTVLGRNLLLTTLFIRSGKT